MIIDINLVNVCLCELPIGTLAVVSHHDAVERPETQRPYGFRPEVLSRHLFKLSHLDSLYDHELVNY